MYTECPHCSAIFTLPPELVASKVRCGECNTVFDTDKAKADLISQSEPENAAVEKSKKESMLEVSAPPPATEIDLTTLDLSEIEKIDAGINDTVDAEIGKIVGDRSSPEKQKLAQELEDDFLFEAKQAKSLGDTLELPVLDDMDYTDHSDSVRRNDMAATLDEASHSEQPLGDDIFDEFISSEEISDSELIDPKVTTPDNDHTGGITAKTSGEKIDDQDDVLPDLDIDIQTERKSATVSPISDKLAATADDLFIQEAPPNSVFTELNPPIENTEEIALPDLQELPAVKRNVNQIVDELRNAATNDDVLRGQIFEGEDQQALKFDTSKLDTQTELPGLEQTPQETSSSPSNEGLDHLISLEEFDLENTPLQARQSKREFLYEYRKMIGAGTLFTLLCLILGGQYMRHNRDEFKHYSATRSITNVICRISGCQIEPPRESEKIKILEHSIFPHKVVENALTVKAKVMNNADGSQPFPVLQVNFFNLSGQKIATRRFGPNEYLKKLPRRSGLMPNSEPVFFEFDIADPGRDGVSFDLQIRQLPR